MLTRKSPSRGRRLVGAGVVALAGLSAGYAAWAAQPSPRVLIQAAAAPVSGVIQLAQADAPAATPHVVRRVVINKDGQTSTYEGDAIPADIQAQIDAAQDGADGSHKFVRIIRRSDGSSADASAEADQLVDRFVNVDGQAHVLKIRCEKTPADVEAVCTTLEGDPAEAAAAIEKLKAEGADGAGNRVVILRREQR